MNDSLNFRPATPGDQAGIVELVDRVYGEYGDRICLEQADADLLHVEEYYLQQGGEFMVLERDEMILGTHAILPLPGQPGCCTFRRLYLDASLRGQQWGEYLMHWALQRAQQREFTRVEFWSDTRFTRAHRFFERLGFETNGQVRTMQDGWITYQEFFYFRSLSELPATISGSQFDNAGENADHGEIND